MPEQEISNLAYFLQGIGQFTGVFLGVLAGSAVSIFSHLYFLRRNEKKMIGNLRFELDLNVKKIEGWLEELENYRNAVNGDTLFTYFGYFNFSTFIGVMAFQLHNSGIIYKHLSHKHIGQLQEVYNTFSLPIENYINNQIDQRKKYLSDRPDLWQSNIKPEVVADINFWQKKLKSHL